MITDPKLDLVLERIVDIAPELVWRGWTEPEHVKRWFTPAPWSTVQCEIDLRPGGMFRTVMRSPEGQEFSNLGCFLEIVPQRKLVLTNALQPGFRPASTEGNRPFKFTAVILIEPQGTHTKYKAIALHQDAESRNAHDEMGFLVGWGTALNQLVAYMKTARP